MASTVIVVAVVVMAQSHTQCPEEKEIGIGGGGGGGKERLRRQGIRTSGDCVLASRCCNSYRNCQL